MANIHRGSEDASGLRFAVVVARYNDFITKPLLDGCLRTLAEAGAASDDVDAAGSIASDVARSRRIIRRLPRPDSR